MGFVRIAGVGLGLVAALAACDGATGKGGDSGSDSVATTGSGACASVDPNVPAAVRDAIATTCSHFVECGEDTCSSCVDTFEASYLGATSYTQEYYAESTLCFAGISCAELEAQDFSDCVGTFTHTGY